MNGNKYHNQNTQKKDRRLRQENPRSTDVGEEDEPQSRKVHNGPPSDEHQQQKVDTIFVEVGMESTAKQRNYKGWEVALTRDGSKINVRGLLQPLDSLSLSSRSIHGKKKSRGGGSIGPAAVGGARAPPAPSLDLSLALTRGKTFVYS